MNDKNCKCVCHEPRFAEGLKHDTVCCPKLNGWLEWRAVKKLLTSQKSQWIEKILELEEDILTRLASLRYSGLEDMVDALSDEIKEKFCRILKDEK